MITVLAEGRDTNRSYILNEDTSLLVSFAFILLLQLDYYIYIYLILRILFSIGIYSFYLRHISFKQLCEAFIGKAYSTIAWKAIFDML